MFTDRYFIVQLAVIFAVPPAVIIISDCLCQQWLDRTHKVTNPIKLIIQVLNYTRKHRYPERRSAFTYIDEEQPKRIDYGKEKFGGPFIEEEVEDVKTVFRLLPLTICLSFIVSALGIIHIHLLSDNVITNIVLNHGLSHWLFPVVLIPFYHFMVRPCMCSYSPSMLRRIGIGLFMCILGFILLLVSGVWGVVRIDDVHRYTTCEALNTTLPTNSIEWYWKLGPYLLYGVGNTIIYVLLLVFIIAQSPDKMKGFFIGIELACRGLILLINMGLYPLEFTLCYDVISSASVLILFVIFLVLSKRYTLRERNREINIQAIVEEHYDRYLDQEEQYIRENPHYFDPIESDSDEDSVTHSTK